VEVVMEYLRLYLPTVVSVIMTIVIPLTIRSIWTKAIERRLEKIDARLQDSIKESNVKDMRADIQEIRNDICQMLGKPPKKGKQQ